MKLFRRHIETVKASQFYFGISLPSVVFNGIEKFEHKFRLRTELPKAFV